MDAQRPGHAAQREPLREQLADPGPLHVLLPWPSEPPALRLCAPHTGDHAIADQVPLELGDGGQGVEQEPPARLRRIDRLVEIAACLSSSSRAPFGRPSG